MPHNLLAVGNPNSGKTTLFNALTGSKQQIGNWAGVTVEKKTGTFTIQEHAFVITDLPGIYSLDTNQSLDEHIATKEILTKTPNVFLNIIDATSIERGLYVTLQLRELGTPMIVVINKMDALKQQKKVLNLTALEQYLQCPVIGVCATDQEKIAKLKNRILQFVTDISQIEPYSINYGEHLEAMIAKLTLTIKEHKLDQRFLAIRELEQISTLAHDQLTNTHQEIKQQLHDLNLDIDLCFANVRYSKIYEICKNIRRNEGGFNRSITEKIDSVLLHQWIGLPFFLLVMYLLFMFAINVGSAFVDFFDIIIGAVLVDGGQQLLSPYLPSWLVTIVANGIGGGIQAVTTFIPVIFCLYLALSVIETSGYMARAAFVLDKMMQKIGLSGKAFVPLVLGFGCSVPSIMAARTLEQENERKLIATMTPFMSCGAKLPVYTLLVAAFFTNSNNNEFFAGQNIVFLLYAVGIIVAILVGLLLKNTLYKMSSNTNFIMEMPNYELPNAYNVLLRTWQKLRKFITGAGVNIIVVVTILSFLNSLGTDGSFGNEDTSNSVLSKTAQLVTPIFTPMGIKEDNWPATVGIITGIFAKEAVIGTLNNLYSAHIKTVEAPFDLPLSIKEGFMSIIDNLSMLNYGDPIGINIGDLSNLDEIATEQEVELSIFHEIQTKFVSASASLAYLIFILLYTPCLAAMGTYKREFGSRFAVYIGIGTFGLAYSCATLFYQVTYFTYHPVTSSIWIIAIIFSMLVIYKILKNVGLNVSNSQ